ncbi:hypothetical protein [Streptomyces roseolus]|uniref:hypothetical protein n=1 Tax=Streptomyces roseolus TaxID=67358 RepID=UPI00364FAECD
MDKSYGTIWVCQDCMLHHANGECGGCHEGHDEEPLSSIGEGFHVAMGMLASKHPCTADYEPMQEREHECDCETNTFSTSQCEGCGSHLHGERHAMTLFGPKSA